MKENRYYDIVASFCNETCRVNSYLIYGGFSTKEEAIEYINTYDISAVDYDGYCRDDETPYIEIEEHHSLTGDICEVITVD